MRVLNVQQGSDEWRRARAGLVSASRLSDVLSKGRSKNEESRTRANYRAQLIAERLTGEPAEDVYQNAAMLRGTEQEPFARAAYEAHRGVLVEQVGLVLHESIPGACGSPDGLVGDDGGVEIKCPNTATHIDYILKGVAPADYIPQMQWLMACTGRAWWDFVSFDIRLPAPMSLFVVRVERDPSYIDVAERAVSEFNAEVDEYISALKKKAGAL